MRGWSLGALHEGRNLSSQPGVEDKDTHSLGMPRAIAGVRLATARISLIVTSRAYLSGGVLQ